MKPGDDDVFPTLEWPGHEDDIERSAPVPDVEVANAADIVEDVPTTDDSVPELTAEPSVTAFEPLPTEPVAPASPALLPALALRLDGLNGTVGALSMRIETLGATIAGTRSMLADRLSDYAELISAMTRSQVESIDEYRHGNDRANTELRRSMAESDEIIRRVAARVDEIARSDFEALSAVRTDIESLGNQLSQARSDSVTAAQFEKELETLNAAIERLSVVAQSGSSTDIVSALHDDIVASLQQEVGVLRSEMRSFETNLASAVGVAMREGVDALRSEMRSLETNAASAVGVAMREAVDALRSEMRSLETTMASGVGAAVSEAVDALRSEMRSLETNTASDVGAAVGEAVDVMRNDLRSVETNSALAVGAAVDEAVDIMRRQLQGIERSGGSVPELKAISHQLSDELVALRTEVVQLKRRIGLRGKPSAPGGGLEAEQLAELADRVANGMKPVALSDADVARIVAAVAAHLEQAFEVVDARDGAAAPESTADESGDEPVPAKRRRR